LRIPWAYHLPEAEFIERLRQLQGTPEEILHCTELLHLLLPLLRADFEVCETYQYNAAEPLWNCPEFGGSEKRDLV
jgi:medium-chain acyl-[acyl-carrier-protein] hydrolase